jgi:phytoene desaturase
MNATVGIVGAGPGGLAAGVLLQSRGFQVEIFEAQNCVGGRNAQVQVGDFKFDLGPTFFLMPSVLEEIFHNAGVSASDYLQLKKVDPLYKLDFGAEQELWIHQNKQKMSQEIAKFSARDADLFYSFRDRQKRKFDAILPALRQPFSGVKDFVKAKNMSALPYLDTRSVYDELCDYFEDERVRLAFTFQAKYLGMSPFDCPSMFTILPHIEHEYGVWHPIGGCTQVSQGLARLFEELGGKIHLSTPVVACETRQAKITHLNVAGQERCFDHYIMNADFAHGMKNLFSNVSRKKFTDQRLDKMKYSCSTFMIYLGLEGECPEWPHHAIYFSDNYRKNIRELTETFELSQDPSFYIHNPSRVDPTLAPQGKSSIYILVPAPNQDSGLSWTPEETKKYRKLIFDKIQERTGIDLRPRILQEKIITPRDWQNEYRVFKGATFSLAHTFSQMLYWRPHNNSEEFSNLYIVGGGTHPGSGLPTILESGRIAADLIDEKQKLSILDRVKKRAWDLLAKRPKDLSELLTQFRSENQ